MHNILPFDEKSTPDGCGCAMYKGGEKGRHWYIFVVVNLKENDVTTTWKGRATLHSSRTREETPVGCRNPKVGLRNRSKSDKYGISLFMTRKLFQSNSWSPATWLPASECSPSKRADHHLLWVWQEQLGEAVVPDWHSQPQHSEHPRKPTVNCVIHLRLIDPSDTRSIVIFSYYPRECFLSYTWNMFWMTSDICYAFKVLSHRSHV